MKQQLFYLLMLFSSISSAQNLTPHQIDSVKKILKNHNAEDSIRVNLYITIGNAYLMSDSQQANSFTDSALTLAEKINWITGIAGAYRQKGVLSVNNADFANAITYFQKALKEGAPLKNEKLNSSIDLNLGLIYLNTEEYPQAITSFKKALAYGEKTKEPLFLTYSLNNIGISFLRLQQLDSSIYYLERSLPIAEQNQLHQVLSFNYTNLGAAYNAKKDYVTAQKYFEKGMTKADQIGDVASKAQALLGLAEVNTFLKETEKAISLCNKSIELSKQLNNLQWQKEAYSMLADNYHNQQKFELALSAYKNFIELRDSMMNDEKKSEIVKRDLEFKNEIASALAQAELKREKERKNMFMLTGVVVLILSITGFVFYKRNRDSEQKQKEIAAALRIKDTELKALRLQMNPHFIDNALQSIQHFMNGHKGEEAEEYLVKFSSLMRAMLMNSERDEISLAKELDTLEWYMQLENLRMNYPFTYKFTIDENVDAENTTIPPNILQPFVENSIKHGLLPKNASGTISIHIYKKENELHIIVEDDGIGRDDHKRVRQSALFKHESLGIKITQERLNILNLMKNINAAFRIVDLNENNTPTGTRVELNLPYQS